MIFGPRSSAAAQTLRDASLGARAEGNYHMTGDRADALARLLLEKGYVSEPRTATAAAAEILLLAEQMEHVQRPVEEGQVASVPAAGR